MHYVGKAGYKMTCTPHKLGKHATREYKKESIMIAPVWVGLLFSFFPFATLLFFAIMRTAVKIRETR